MRQSTIGTGARELESLDSEFERPIELHNIEVSFRNIKALNNVSFDTPAGTITGLIGRNGAGKSTTINILAGLLAPGSGEVLLLGEQPPYSPRVKQGVGFVLEDLALFSYLTAEETLLYLGESYGLASDAPKRTEDLLGFFGLRGAKTTLVEDMSTGMRKRLAIAAALIHSPRVLILDEPFESLDPVMVRRVSDILTNFAASGGTILLSSHLINTVENLCDRIVILEQGRVVVAGRTQEAIAASTERLEQATLEQLYISIVQDESTGSLPWLLPSE